MSTQEIQELIDFISKSGLDEVKIETSELKINVKRTATPAMYAAPAPVQAAPAAAPALPAAAPAAAPTAAPAPSPAAPAASATNQITIKSPMIGTFYRSANPESPLFVEVGDEIKPGKVVCIIEAMKLFNEIEAEVSGRIVKVLVENATPVEYDQPLFILEEI
ncbi:acetyl-CoA carboxylase biotin carboxyl carrier protein [Fibrella aquatilis]|uniref:Biotin carboxyl carrier protein of acetyl-CoA carboxylase n=1 Tax=Fibrella aquatilis TaxID=2817059 RepID=A0A939G931_9BACT|nr:acetyl-CoA carboxylase biotin carboxyl carrier protein [Fibrella aquatilis]MBO0934707.1 acetyl-CoA carboxylase biotin carboxyl carrier protein [Fibrella aquatilis]